MGRAVHTPFPFAVTEEEVLGYDTRRSVYYECEVSIWPPKEWKPRKYPQVLRACMLFWAVLPGKMQQTVAVPIATWSIRI